jgi:hypothetical protein
MKNEKDLDLRREILRKFPLYVQEVLLESSVLSRELELSNIHNIREFILEEFAPFIQKFDNVIISTLIENNLRCLNLDEIKEENPWKNCDEEDVKKVRETILQKKTEIHDNPYGYYGILNKNTDKFSIADIKAEKTKERLTKTGKVDSRRASTGRVCATWKHTDLLVLIDKIKLEFPKEFLTKNSKKTDEELLREYILYKDDKYTEVAGAFTEDVFKDMPREDKLRVMFWGRSGKDSIKKTQICEAIQKWFKDNNLLEEKITK